MSMSVQLGEYIYPPKKITVGAKQTPAIEINYRRMDGEHNGKHGSARYLVGRLDDDSRKVLESLKDGDKFVVVKEKQGEYWNFKEFRSADSFQAKQPSDSYSKGTKQPHQKKEYDDTGVKVGAARNQALAYLAATRKDGNWSLDDVDSTAYEIIKRQAAMEAMVRSGMDVAPTTEENFSQSIEEDDSVPF